MIQWFKDHSSRFTGQLLFDEPLSKHTYYRIGGPASIYATPQSPHDVEWLAQGIAHTQIPYFVLGLGSNLLISDLGFSGLIIRAGRLNLGIELVEETESRDLIVRTGGSVAISTFLRKAAHQGWAGLELLSGVPGSMAGAVSMNAGTHLGEAKDCVVRVEAFSLDSEHQGARMAFSGEQLKFSYRRNHFLPKNTVIYSVDWRLRRSTPESVKHIIDENLVRRKASQPVEYPSCGSVFKNPRESGFRAWEVIAKLGLRGHRIGNAQFSEKHPNFIVNLGGAQAIDVKALIDLAKARALELLGVTLEEEVIYVGSF